MQILSLIVISKDLSHYIYIDRLNDDAIERIPKTSTKICQKLWLCKQFAYTMLENGDSDNDRRRERERKNERKKERKRIRYINTLFYEEKIRKKKL